MRQVIVSVGHYQLRNLSTNMTKQELLDLIENKELSRLNTLPTAKLQEEISEWFNDEILECESREDMTNDYMNDFMRYRQDESIEELQEVLTRYN